MHMKSVLTVLVIVDIYPANLNDCL